MADNIPFEIQTEIMKRLPIKSLIRFKSVSKQWKSIIGSYKFIVDYHTDQQHLLISYVGPEDYEKKYFSIVDDDSFPQHTVSLTVPSNKTIAGSSHGLFFWYSFYGNQSDSGTDMAILWNPAIRKSVAFDVPNVLKDHYETILGFGVVL